jgi:HSP20 family molecular chaperone IbpA
MAFTPKKRNFFDRLSGGAATNEYDDFDEADVRPAMKQVVSTSATQAIHNPALHNILDDEPMEGQLPVDVYQTANEIVIRAFVAGVRADELSLSISRDMVVIEGSRESREQIADPDYFSQELFWGSFTRTVLLPQEIDVDNSSATSKDGLLTIMLPKLDKARQTKLKVRAG